jgi:hypothetical protein
LSVVFIVVLLSGVVCVTSALSEEGQLSQQSTGHPSRQGA